MLRITPQRLAGKFILKVEGSLVGAWVTELDTAWQNALRNSEAAPVVDLSDVCTVDEAGRGLLVEMHRGGARFVTKGCFMSEVVREIAQAAGRVWRN